MFEIARKHHSSVIWNGVIAVSEGPRFETKTEVHALRLQGATLAGMTSAPEVFLANELGLPYATLGVVTNFAAGMQKQVTHEEVIKLFDKLMPTVKAIILETASAI